MVISSASMTTFAVRNTPAANTAVPYSSLWDLLISSGSTALIASPMLGFSYNFPKYHAPGTPDFRDPRVFWNDKKDCWSLVLASGDHAEFYASQDLKNWMDLNDYCREIT